jgi:hypothetical protein
VKLRVPVVSFKAVEIGRKTKAYDLSGGGHHKTDHKRLKILAIPLLLALIAAGVIFAVVKNLEAPAQGAINQTPPAAAEKQDPYPIAANYSGKYIELTYPAHYKRISSAVTGSYLEVFSVYSTDQTGKSITVSVQKGSLADSSGISYRKAHPELYTEEPRTRLGVTYTAKTTPEKVAFLEHNGLLATVAITAQSNIDLNSDLQTVLNSFKWK